MSHYSNVCPRCGGVGYSTGSGYQCSRCRAFFSAQRPPEAPRNNLWMDREAQKNGVRLTIRPDCLSYLANRAEAHLVSGNCSW